MYGKVSSFCRRKVDGEGHGRPGERGGEGSSPPLSLDVLFFSQTPPLRQMGAREHTRNITYYDWPLFRPWPTHAGTSASCCRHSLPGHSMNQPCSLVPDPSQVASATRVWELRTSTKTCRQIYSPTLFLNSSMSRSSPVALHRQLGHGNESGHPKPCMVKHLRDEGARVTQIACGSRHTVVLTDLGKVSVAGHERNRRRQTCDTCLKVLLVCCCAPLRLRRLIVCTGDWPLPRVPNLRGGRKIVRTACVQMSRKI